MGAVCCILAGGCCGGSDCDSVPAGSSRSEVRQECVSLFEEGIRAKAADGSSRTVYVIFATDSSKAELFFSDGSSREILEQRRLPSGEHVWNMEDDDTKNLRVENGCWTLRQRGELLFKQPEGDEDLSLGEWKKLEYEGLLPAADGMGIRYELSLRHREFSGDGYFLLSLTYLEAENGRDVTFSYMGSRVTQRGIPADNDAVVWQLIPDTGDQPFNFLFEDEETLVLLNSSFEKSRSELNYTLKRKL